jgi:Predicted esterase of the alpha-beta hydrolase superfamily
MKIALVLQGGGARGIFTSGILDALLDSKIEIDHIYAVSAGALNAMNYISKQKNRNRIATSLTFKSKEFKSVKNVLRKHTFVDFDYYFHGLNEVLPFDLKTFNESNIKFSVVATSLSTGQAKYFSKDDKTIIDFFDCIKASASIPLVAKSTMINDELYLDGGDSDPLPYKKAIDDGYDKVILVTTRPLDFRKANNLNKRMNRLYNLAYKQYPNYLKSLENSHKNYNQKFDDLTLYKDKIFIFAPKENILLKHLETNEKKLDYYYNLGFDTFNDNLKRLLSFLK